MKSFLGFSTDRTVPQCLCLFVVRESEPLSTVPQVIYKSVSDFFLLLIALETFVILAIIPG